MNELPDGWVLVKLDDVGQWGSGGTPTRTNSNYYNGGTIPWLVIGDLNDDYVRKAKTHITEEGLQNSSAKLLPAGTVLVAMYGSIGKLGITAIECATNQAIAFCKPNLHIVSLRYLFYTLRWAKPTLLNLGQGGAQQNISQGMLRNFQIPLAPQAEQIRIADQLDRMLARIQSCNERINAIPTLLKRFRQAVLDAATLGELTSDWRDANRLPFQWEKVCLRDIADVQGGVTKDSKKQSASDEAVPYLRVANVQRGHIDLREVKTIRVPREKLEDLLLESGDVLFNEGGDLDKLGRGWIWEGQISRCTFQNHVFRARLYDPSNQPKFVSWWGNSRGLEYFLRSGKQTTNLASINKTMLAALPISLPSKEEQAEIVRRVEALFKLADRIEARYTVANAQAQRLTQLLLAKAFRGELMPQDSNDEPAAELLQRLVNTGTARAVVRKRSPKKKEMGSMNKNVAIPVIDALQAAKKPLTATALLAEAGYPADASTELVERFFLDIRNELESRRIERVRRGTDDFFSLVQ